MPRLLWLLPVAALACSKSPPAEKRELVQTASVNADGKQVIDLAVTAQGFVPTPVKVKAGQPVELRITRKTETTCATEIVVKDHNINQKLPLNETVAVSFTPAKSGELKYGCAMDQMIAGVLLVE